MADREIIKTQQAAAPAAYYSQAISADGFVFTAGCVGVNPETGEVESGGVVQQTRRALQNIEAILTAAGTALNRVVKTTCYLKRPEDFPRFDSVYRDFFPPPPPARTTVVCELVREEFLVELEVIARV